MWIWSAQTSKTFTCYQSYLFITSKHVTSSLTQFVIHSQPHYRSFLATWTPFLPTYQSKCKSELGSPENNIPKLGWLKKIKNKLDIHPSHFLSFMVGFPNFIYGGYNYPNHFPEPTFLILKFVFYLYIEVLFGNIFDFDLMLFVGPQWMSLALLWFQALFKCCSFLFFFDTQRNCTFKDYYFLPKLLERHGIHSHKLKPFKPHLDQI